MDDRVPQGDSEGGVGLGLVVSKVGRKVATKRVQLIDRQQVISFREEGDNTALQVYGQRGGVGVVTGWWSRSGHRVVG